MNESKSVKAVFLSITSALAIVFAFEAVAAETRLNSEEIRAYLSERTIEGKQKETEWVQTFGPGNHTTYTEIGATRPGGGYWKAENDMYCSQWPPSDHWDCYIFTADGDRLTFIPQGGGDPWPARRLPKKSSSVQQMDQGQ